MSIFDNGPYIFLPLISSNLNFGCFAAPALVGNIRWTYLFLFALKIVSNEGVAEPSNAGTLSLLARTTNKSRAEY